MLCDLERDGVGLTPQEARFVAGKLLCGRRSFSEMDRRLIEWLWQKKYRDPV